MGQGNARNAICHCGSGRKYKRCCAGKDAGQRITGTTFTATEQALLTGIQIGPGGELRLLSGDRPFEVVDAKAAEWRLKQDGSLGRVAEIDVPEPLLGAPYQALRDADFVFGVDTNKAVISGVSYNISCLTCATRQVAPAGYDGSIQQMQAVDFCDDGYAAERIGWIFAIEASRRFGVASNHKVVLCTDHDVAAHTAINQGVQSIIGDYKMPPNFTLMYARDKGSSVPNKLVAAADKGAHGVRRMIEGGSPAPPQAILPSLLQGRGAQGARIWWSDAYRRYFAEE